MNSTEFNEFNRLAPVLERAVAYTGGSHTIADIAEMVQDGRLQFWPALRSVVVTEIMQAPQTRSLHIFLAAGDIQELEMMLPTMERFAKDNSCTSITMAGRPGWARSFLKQRGFSPKYLVMAKDL